MANKVSASNFEQCNHLYIKIYVTWFRKVTLFYRLFCSLQHAIYTIYTLDDDRYLNSNMKVKKMILKTYVHLVQTIRLLNKNHLLLENELHLMLGDLDFETVMPKIISCFPFECIVPVSNASQRETISESCLVMPALILYLINIIYLIRSIQSYLLQKHSFSWSRR